MSANNEPTPTPEEHAATVAAEFATQIATASDADLRGVVAATMTRTMEHAAMLGTLQAANQMQSRINEAQGHVIALQSQAINLCVQFADAVQMQVVDLAAQHGDAKFELAAAAVALRVQLEALLAQMTGTGDDDGE